MSGKTLLGIIWLATLGSITVVDYILGPTAEYLNAWEIIRRSFGLNTTLGQSPATEKFLFCQDFFGPLALPAGWVFFFLEGLVIAMIILGIILFARYVLRRG